MTQQDDEESTLRTIINNSSPSEVYLGFLVIIAITIGSCANPSWWCGWKRSVGVRTQELQAVVVDRPPHGGGAHEVVPQVLSYLYTEDVHQENMIHST